MDRRTAHSIRVLHLTPEFPPVIWGGLGTAVGGLVYGSAQAGVTVGVLLVGGVLVLGERGYGGGEHVTEELLNSASLEMADASGVTFFHIPPNHALDTCLRLVQAWQPDVIHLHTAWLWPMARDIRERIRTPVAFTVHSLDRAEYEVGGIGSSWEVQESAIREADRVIALSQSEKDLLLKYVPGVRHRVRIVGNGIDDCITAREAVRQDRRSSSPVVLYTGRFVDRKGVRELLAAIPLVLEQAPATRFVLVGGYGRSAEIEQTWLTDALRMHRSQIHFTGWLAPDEVADWYASADVLVVPSWYEPFGMVILEGMLHGLPIAACNVGGPAEILEHGQTGLLFPPKDVDALAQSLLSLVKDPGLRRRIGAAAAEEVRRGWLWPRMVEKMRAVYQEAINLRHLTDQMNPSLSAERSTFNGKAEKHSGGGIQAGPRGLQ
jgi:glycogen synthase